jgi:hypothetical protein
VRTSCPLDEPPSPPPPPPIPPISHLSLGWRCAVKRTSAGVIHDVDGVRLGRARLQGFKGKCEQRKGNAMSTQFNDRRNPNASLIGCVIKSTVTAHLSLLPVLYCNRCSACPAQPSQPASQPSAYPFPHLVPTRRVDLHKGAPISVSVRWPFFFFCF